MDMITTLLGRTRARLLRLVRRSPASINDLASAVGITDNAVRGHVAAMERDGLLREESQRATGGKPARVYDLTQEGEELFPKAYALVLQEMIATVRDDEGDDAAVAMLREVGRRLGAASAAANATEAARVAAVSALLESLGGSIEAERSDDAWLLRSAGCPLSRVVADTPEACGLVESMVAEITRQPVREVCDRAGRPRCAFRIESGTRETPPSAA
ncbi:MAG TPA: helix-turn-helix domain-containing protein [Longimicrobiales bacterium]